MGLVSREGPWLACLLSQYDIPFILLFKTPTVAPLHLVGVTRALFFLISGFTSPALEHVGWLLFHYAETLLCQLKHRGPR